MFGQDVLRIEVARRIGEAGTNCDPTGLPALPADTPDTTVIVVLRDFDTAVFALSAIEFALGIDPGRRTEWLRAFTRTIFLAGNPANLTARFRFDHIAEDGSVAWFGPASADSVVGLRRLLKLFGGTVEPGLVPEMVLDVPGSRSGSELRLRVATAGVSFAEYLVHLNHTLVEGVLTGLIEPGDRVVLQHVPMLGGDPGPYRALRVHADGGDSSRLRVYACLSDQAAVSAGGGGVASGETARGPVTEEPG